MYEHTIGVPLILCGPGIPAGKRLAIPIYLRDLYPTVCELAGVPIPQTVEARSCAAAIRTGMDRTDEQVFAYFANSQRAIRTDRWKLIHYPHIKRTQLFDLTADPDEVADLSADPRHSEVLADLRHRLDAWRRTVNDPTLDTAP